MKYSFDELEEMRTCIKKLNPNYFTDVEYINMIEMKLQTCLINNTSMSDLEFEVKKKADELAKAQKIFKDNIHRLEAKEEAEFAEKLLMEKAAKESKKGDIGFIDHIIRALTR